MPPQAGTGLQEPGLIIGKSKLKEEVMKLLIHSSIMATQGHSHRASGGDFTTFNLPAVAP
jgi:hypothetical protein